MADWAPLGNIPFVRKILYIYVESIRHCLFQLREEQFAMYAA